MTSMILSITVQVALLGAGVEATPASIETYAEARRTATETGKPIVVMVSTDWCPPCQVMKKQVMPQVRERGLLRKVAFALVNPDRDRELADKLIGDGPIPQLVMFRRTSGGWARKSLVGGQSVEAVEQFISDGLEKDKANAEESAKKKDETGEKQGSQTAHRDSGDARHG
jgi:thioredoxin-like negative regulator of GroEL